MSREFTPENTKDTLYINCGSFGGWSHNLLDIFAQAQSHFGENIELFDLDIGSEYIHTRCIGYDLYDSSDYDCFLVITLRK